MSAATTTRDPAERLRLAAVCAALFALALKQAPGLLVGDTKFDLSVDPWRFLGRSLHLWDPSRDFGLTQNQAYGYLFPMGPFFGLGRLVGLPPWVIERLWWGVLMSIAFLGVMALAKRLGFGTPTSRLLGALAFALSPRVLSTLGPTSVETLPYCLAPWVVVPLVTGAREGSTRRAGALSAVAVLLMGAVNAAAVLAALPPAALWLLTCEKGPRRRSLQRWWVGCVVLATAWWVGPLLLLGKYSPPFLDHIETASTTTSVTSLVEVLRGTSDWVGYLAGVHGPTWPTAFALLTGGTVVLYTLAVAAGGFAGVLRRDLPQRLWLVSCLLLGVAAVTAGHVSRVDGLFAGTERQLLDGALAPFRNVHKFEVDLRLPLVLALVHLLPRLAHGPQVRRWAVHGAALAAVLGAAVPAISPGLAPRHPFTEIPGYWRQTAAWLGAHQAEGRALLVPGSSAPDYLWGSSNDEPMQPLARSEWTVRSAIPLTPQGTIRALDAVEQRLATGTPSPGLAADLARAGVHYVVVRNDLDYGAAPATRPLLVHAAVAGSPGLTRVATFGGDVGGNGVRTVDEGLELPFPAVEVFAVDEVTPRATLHPVTDLVDVAGGPEDLLDLEDRGLLGDRPAVLATDGREGSSSVLTDGLRRREVFSGGGPDDSTSATLTATDPYRIDEPAHDHLPAGAQAHQSVAQTVGAEQVGASSSRSDADAFGGAEREHQPSAAVDGDPQTTWEPDLADAAPSWHLTFTAPRTLTGLVVTGTPGPGGILVRSDTARAEVTPDGSVDLPGTTSTVTISGATALAEVTLPDLTVGRTLVTDVGAAGSVVALSSDGTDRAGCVGVGDSQLCEAGLARGGEDTVALDRTVRLAGGGSYALAVTAVARPGRALDALLDKGTGVTALASSSEVADPGGRPGTVVDGELGTGWRAAAGDQDPTLSLAWPAEQVVRGIQIRVAPSFPVAPVTSVRVEGGGQVRSGTLQDGFLSFPPIRTSRLLVHLRAGVPPTSLDPFSLVTSLLPVGVSELTVLGATAPSRPGDTLSLPCGAGPTVTVGDRAVPTSVVATRAQLLSARPVPALPCDRSAVTLGTGTRVVARRSALLRADSVTLTPTQAAPQAVQAVQAVSALLPLSYPVWGDTRREVEVPARSTDTVLDVHENTNPGWVAMMAGHRLRPVVLDGWQQGWVVPAGSAGTVRLVFTPDRTFRLGLLVGGLLVLVLLALATRSGTSDAPALVDQPLRLLPAAALGVLLLLIGGPLAAALAVVAALLRRRERVSTALALGCLGAAAALLALRPWPTAHYAGRSTTTQVLCLVAVAFVWATVLPGPRLAKRRTGRSSST